jgi:hypothetical protein
LQAMVIAPNQPGVQTFGKARVPILLLLGR